MRLIALTLGMLTLAGCHGDPHLMNIKAGQRTPDEFAILPTKPLSMPADLAQLPTPTPGGSNITDPTPDADAVAALGGNPAQLSTQGIPATDGALVAYAGRGGVNPQIRGQLAAADVTWRSGNRRRPLEVLARTSVYQRAYRPMALDPYTETERWRLGGARTPTNAPQQE